MMPDWCEQGIEVVDSAGKTKEQQGKVEHHAQLFELMLEDVFYSTLGVRRTVKSSTAAVVAGSLHPDEKPLSAELHRYHGLGVDVALLQLGFDVADLDPLPLITNDLME